MTAENNTYQESSQKNTEGIEAQQQEACQKIMIDKVDITDGHIRLFVWGQKFYEPLYRSSSNQQQITIDFARELQYVGKAIEQQALYGKATKTDLPDGCSALTFGFDENGRLEQCACIKEGITLNKGDN